MNKCNKILVVTSKAPPEYSGSGNRIVKQYQRIEKINISPFSVLCSSTEKVFSLPIFNRNRYPQISFKLTRLFSILNQTLIYKTIMYVEFLLEFHISYFYIFLKFRNYNFYHIIGDVALTSAALSFCEKNNIPFIYEIVNEDKNKYDPLWIRVPFWQKAIKFKPSLSTVKTINLRLKEKIRGLHPSINVVSFPNSVDLTQIEKSRKKNNKQKTDIIKIIYLAKYIPRKQQDILIKSFKYLPNNYTLDICGPISYKGLNSKRDSIYLKNLKNLINDLKLNEKINLHVEYVDYPYELISNYDIFVYPSKNEAFGTPIIEAILLGLSVVATSGEPAFEEWVCHGKNGYLFDGTPLDLSKKIIACNILDQKIKEKHNKKIGLKVNHEAADNFLIKEIQNLMLNHDI